MACGVFRGQHREGAAGGGAVQRAVAIHHHSGIAGGTGGGGEAIQAQIESACDWYYQLYYPKR
jgi:hypothetical protein